MARRWTAEEESKYKHQLECLYIQQNLSISEIGEKLAISEKTVFQRLQRLQISTAPESKVKYQNRRSDIILPNARSADLAELFGILLGDGHITHHQVVVTLGNKEAEYANHVRDLIEKNFGGSPKICILKKGYHTVYLGSTLATQWLFSEGLVKNKVREQVDIPEWIFTDPSHMKALVRGFFDTDGSVYKLRFGTQIGLSNRSARLLKSLQRLLICLEYNPSKISCHQVYLTRRKDIERFFSEISPKNPRHLERYKVFQKCVGTQAVNEGRL